MKDDEKTREQLIAELTKLRSQNAALKKSINGNISAELAEEEGRKAYFRFLENLERVDQAIKQETDVEQMLRHILQAVFSIFDCDRAWLVYPCDPDAPSFRVPMEISRPGYPGAKVLNMDVPMSTGEARNMREALSSDEPVTYIDGTERPIMTAAQFGVQSQMFIPIYPKVGKPWVFGMHQCSYPRIWTEEEKKLFKEIGRRISDGLSSVLFLRELQESEERYRKVFEHHAAVKFLIDPDTGSIIEANEAAVNYYGWSREQLKQMKIQEINTLPPEDVKKAFEEALTRKRTHFEFRHRRVDGSIRDVEVFSSKIEVKGKDILHSIIHDITERKQAEEELRKSEDRFCAIADYTYDWENWFGPDGKLIWVNSGVFRFTGYTVNECLNISDFPLPLIDEVDREKFDQHFTAAVQKASANDVEIRIRHKDRGLKFAAVSYQPIYDSNGTYLGHRSSARDITERKQAEEAMREINERLSLALEVGNAGIWLWNLKRDEVCLDDRFHVMLGYTPGELPNTLQEWLSYHHPEDIPVWMSKTKAYLRGESPIYESEHRIRNKTGTWSWVFTRGKFVNQPSAGSPEQFTGIAMDITERKRAEEALRKSEEKYRNIFENATEGIYQATPEGRFLTVNAAFTRMAGYDSPEDFIESIGKIGPHLFVHPEDRKRFSEIMAKSGIVNGFEVEFNRNDGSTFWVVINSRMVKDKQGKIIYYEGIVEDVTLRKQAEEKLLQTLDNLRKAFSATVQVLVAAVESRDPYTAGHQIRSADLARSIATEMGLSQKRIDGIRMAGSIHDIGKISVPAEILSTPKKLTELEFSLIKEHANKGFEMLKGVDSPWPLAEIIHQHHERMDGSGYPRHLKGEEILMEARILAVADVVEAMASHRPYRAALGLNAALAEIEDHKGTLYDAEAVDACLRLFREKGFQLEGTVL